MGVKLGKMDFDSACRNGIGRPGRLSLLLSSIASTEKAGLGSVESRTFTAGSALFNLGKDHKINYEINIYLK